MKNENQHGGHSGGPVNQPDHGWLWAVIIATAVVVAVICAMMLGRSLAEQNEQTQEVSK